MNLSTTEIDIQFADKQVLARPSEWQLALSDIKQSVLSWRIWLLIGWQDIRLRYRRSSLGPFWITLSMAITIYTMGFLYGHLFKMDLNKYYPYLAAGMLTWNLINLLIIDGANAFIEADNYLKQMKLPYSVFLMRIVWRSLIVFAHNIVVIVPILIIFHVPMGLNLLMIIPGLFIIAVTGLCYGLVLAMFGARYRDVSQIIVSLMQVAFFLTPVMWNASILPPRYHYIVEFNPLAQFVELLRAPLTGTFPTTYSLVLTSCIAILGAGFALSIFVRNRKRIIYWL
jgi:ABC-type polysaccharide/polyol phosphate export permease